jgi:hypothetical protein
MQWWCAARTWPPLAARELKYGKAFQGIVEARVSAETVVATVDASAAKDSAHLAHPAVLDVALQCVAALAAGSNIATEGAVVPAGVRTVRRFRPIPEQPTVLVRLVGTDPLRADVDLIDPDGNQIVAMAGVEFRPISPPGSPLNRLGRLFYEPGGSCVTGVAQTAGPEIAGSSPSSSLWATWRPARCLDCQHLTTALFHISDPSFVPT